ncbi:MAG: hypothetical protein ACK40G_06865 [Cytophagaceae bacterium]
MKTRYFILIIFTFFLSCKKSQDPQPANNNNNVVNPANSQQVSDSLKFNNYERMHGDLPESSGSFILAGSEDRNIKGNAGKTILLPIKSDNGEVAGVYLKVTGAKDYFKIFINTTQRKSETVSDPFRIFKTTNDYLPVRLPATITPGIFCIEYCVFDESGKISNVVTRCIEVLALGGSNSDFLLDKSWQYYSYTEFDNGIYKEKDVFNPNTTVYDILVLCPEHPDGYIKTQYDHTFKINDSRISFQKEGNVIWKIDYEFSYVDTRTSECENLVYIKENKSVDMVYGWTYDYLSEKLILVDDKIEEESNPDVWEVKVKLENGQMKWYDNENPELYMLLRPMN